MKISEFKNGYCYRKEEKSISYIFINDEIYANNWIEITDKIDIDKIEVLEGWYNTPIEDELLRYKSEMAELDILIKENDIVTEK